MEYIDKNKWYAIFVATGDEDKVKERINFRLREDFKVLVPKRKMRERKEGQWKDKIRILFPGYVLLNGQMSNNKYNQLRDIPGVIRLLKDSDGPQEISDSEISIISRLTYNNEIIGSSILNRVGGAIEVIDGPLLGMEGFIRSINERKGRVKVVINLLGEPRTVELSIAMVRPS